MYSSVDIKLKDDLVYIQKSKNLERLWKAKVLFFSVDIKLEDDLVYIQKLKNIERLWNVKVLFALGTSPTSGT